eukprot:103425-Pleurochrysis_carterae.AAC.7
MAPAADGSAEARAHSATHAQPKKGTRGAVDGCKKSGEHTCVARDRGAHCGRHGPRPCCRSCCSTDEPSHEDDSTNMRRCSGHTQRKQTRKDTHTAIRSHADAQKYMCSLTAHASRNNDNEVVLSTNTLPVYRSSYGSSQAQFTRRVNKHIDAHSTRMLRTITTRKCDSLTTVHRRKRT